jgi:acetyl-CoA synthetase
MGRIWGYSSFHDHAHILIRAFMNKTSISNQYNIGYLCTGDQVEQGNGDKVALRLLSSTMERSDTTFSTLHAESNRFANILCNLGIKKGDRVFIFTGKAPEQFIAFLGSLKIQAITGILFANFGEEAIFDRLRDAQASVLITRKGLFRKIARVLGSLPDLKSILLIDLDEHQSDLILSYKTLMREASEHFEVPVTDKDTPSVLHYTSGSTGKPKGVLHSHKSVLLQYQTTKDILGLKAEDIYWCTADQGWVTGVSYGIIGPWITGNTQIQFAGNYDAGRWMTILQDEQVNVWYTAPTALRMLMQEEESIFAPYDFHRLRDIFCVGEPLNPEILHWSRNVLKKEVYDTWFQTETGSIMIANRPGLKLKPGSMGIPVEGIQASIVTEEGNEAGIGETGHLCLRPGWASMFTTYLNNESLYQEKFRNGYYYTGDKGYKDSDGYFWFLGRSDDIINTSGHLVSPFEVESALLEVEEIADVGVIGAPDDLFYEKVVAFVRLKNGQVLTKELILKLRLYISNRVSPVATPQEFKEVQNIPKNKSGKIMRRVLKAWYCGKDAGDLSTMEE